MSAKNKVFWGMTEAAIREAVVACALTFLNIKEGTKRHKEIVALYNSLDPLPVKYPLKESDAWCAAMMTVIGIVLGITDTILPECSCSRMIELYKKAGRWEEKDSYVPEPGDLVMYSWKDDGVGDCTLAPNHVGMVLYVRNGVITIFEGNFDNMAKTRSIKINAKNIRGFCKPAYHELVCGFFDVPKDVWYRQAAEWADDNDIVVGVADNYLAPEATCNRAQAITMLWRSAGKPEPNSKKNPFKDVESGTYYQKAVVWAAEQGITEGVANGFFGPDEFCTRGQIATLLHRFAGEPAAKKLAPFADVEDDSYYAPAVDWAYDKQITFGCAKELFVPGAPCTRAEMIAFLHRYNMVR